MIRIQPHLRTIIIWGISLILCVSAGGTIINLWARRGIVREREQELRTLQQENRNLEGELQDIRGEAYVERIARDKLGMVREGESIVLLPDVLDDSRKGDNAVSLPNWKKWWSLFF